MKEEYAVEVLRPDGTVAEQYAVYGAVEASEFLEDRLRGYPADYWGRIRKLSGTAVHDKQYLEEPYDEEA